MLADASVLRNFAVVGKTDVLVALAGGKLFAAHGVLGIHADEPSEVERIRAAFLAESLRRPGLPLATAATAAVVGLDDLLARRESELVVLVPKSDELELAARLQEPNQRAWRTTLGIKARRLDAGEAVSVAIAVSRDLAFATDDDDGRLAYGALGGKQHFWTLDLFRRAVQQGLLPLAEAKAAYTDLRLRYRVWGPGWP